MAEVKTLVDEDQLTYEGLFDFGELRKAISNYLKNKGYSKLEKDNGELVSPEGKTLHWLVDATCLKHDRLQGTDEVYKKLKIDLNIHNMTDAEIEIDGLKTPVNKGKVIFKLSASKKTHYEGRFEQRPLIQFIQTIFSKFIYRGERGVIEAEIISDLNELKQFINSQLNLSRFRKG